MVVALPIEVEVCSSRNKGEPRLPIQAIQQGLQPVSRPIEIERILGAHEEMNLALMNQKGSAAIVIVLIVAGDFCRAIFIKYRSKVRESILDDDNLTRMEGG